MIGLVVVTHGRLAEEFLSAAEHVVGPQEQVKAVSIGPDDDMEKRRQDILDAAKAVVGTEIPLSVGPRRPGDPSRLVCDGSRAREVLGWEPRRSVMAEMIGDAWGWRQTGRYSA